jgi:hypothetical protein
LEALFWILVVGVGPSAPWATSGWKGGLPTAVIGGFFGAVLGALLLLFRPSPPSKTGDSGLDL